MISMNCDYNVLILCFFKRYGDHQDLHSFPTRRSSDLHYGCEGRPCVRSRILQHPGKAPAGTRDRGAGPGARDRKSTRLNSSHQIISYAVFCLKKKNEMADPDAEEEEKRFSEGQIDGVE